MISRESSARLVSSATTTTAKARRFGLWVRCDGNYGFGNAPMVNPILINIQAQFNNSRYEYSVGG